MFMEVSQQIHRRSPYGLGITGRSELRRRNARKRQGKAIKSQAAHDVGECKQQVEIVPRQ
jgi:hypothetical protein